MIRKISLGVNFVTILALIFCCFFNKEEVEVKKVIEYIDVETDGITVIDSVLVKKLADRIDSLENLEPKIIYQTETVFRIVEKEVPLIIGEYRIDTLYQNDTVIIEIEKDYTFEKSDNYINYSGTIVEDTLQFEVSTRAVTRTIIDLEKRPFFKNKLSVTQMPTSNPYLELDQDFKFTPAFEKSRKKHGIGGFIGVGADYLLRPTVAVGIGYVWKK